MLHMCIKPTYYSKLYVGTFTFNRLENIRTAGVNRISMGVQSFDREALKKCGRAHTPEDTVPYFVYVYHISLHITTYHYISLHIITYHYLSLHITNICTVPHCIHISPTHHATHNTQHTTHTTHATRTTRNTQHTTHNTHNTRNTQHTQHTTHNTQHTTRNTQHTTHNTQHATYSCITIIDTLILHIHTNDAYISDTQHTGTCFGRPKSSKLGQFLN
jgi:hypothetical protein